MRPPALGPSRWPALGVSAAAVFLSVGVLIAPGRFGEVGAASIWGLAVVLCFAGWGAFVARRLVPELAVDWGLRTAWGLALTVAVGGLLCFCGVARCSVLLVWIFGGIALALREMLVVDWPWRQGRRPWAELPFGWEAFLVAGIVVVALYVYVGSTARAIPNPSDDWPAYLPFIRRLLQAGTFVDPFSVRRMAAYGGQSYLQAMTLIVVGNAQIQTFDGGICLLLVLGLVLGFAREARNVSWMVLVLVCVVVLLLPDNRVNSASEMSGVVGFVAAWRTMVLVERNGLRGFRASLLSALPIAAVATLRQSYLPVVAAMLGALLLRGAREDERWRARGRHFGQVALLVGACLLPWAALAFRSNHTFLFPFFHGNYDPAYAGITAPSSWVVRLRFYFGALFHTDPIRTMPLLLLAGPAIAAGANRRACLGLWAGTMVAFAILALSLPDSDAYTIARYDFAYVVAFAIAIGLAASENAPKTVSSRDLTTFGLVIASLALQIYGNYASGLRTLNIPIERIGAMAGAAPSPLESMPEGERKMQEAVPPGARLMVMIERPYLLNFARNQVWLLDQPGAVSPSPGIPLRAGGEKVADYLVGQGIRYLAFSRPDRANQPLYSRPHWKGQLNGSTRIWRIVAPLYLSTFDAVDQIALQHRRLYDDGHLVVVDLMAPA
ncbi:MAG TPA: hypothetical protein VFG23_11865 [Polyangia bacterium]|nr:hypothetical protein [Polyangia bacterium]